MEIHIYSFLKAEKIINTKNGFIDSNSMVFIINSVANE